MIIKINGKSGKGKSFFLKNLIYELNYSESSNKYINKISNELNIDFNNFKGFSVYVPSEPIMVHNENINNNFIKINNQVKKLLNYFELDEKFINNKTSWSLGEGQRICLIRYLSHEYKLFILDESLSGVDINLEAKIINYVSKHCNLILYVSHRNSNLSFNNQLEIDNLIFLNL